MMPSAEENYYSIVETIRSRLAEEIERDICVGGQVFDHRLIEAKFQREAAEIERIDDDPEGVRIVR